MFQLISTVHGEKGEKMYKSPIEIKIDDIISDAVEGVDKYIVRYIQQAGVNVDKDELIKALKFDRGQYEKGWNDRDNEIVRCKDCKWYKRKYPWNGIYECSYLEAPMDDDDFCSWGERREDDNK